MATPRSRTKLIAAATICIASAVASSAGKARAAVGVTTPEDPRRAHAALGAGIITSFSDVGAAFGPSLRFGYDVTPHVLASVWALAPANGSERFSPDGVTRWTARQALAAFDIAVATSPLRRVRAWGGASAGLYHVNVAAESLPVGIKNDAGSFSFIFGAVAAIAWTLRPDIALVLDGGLFKATPRPVVEVRGMRIGTVADPALAVAVSVQLSL